VTIKDATAGATIYYTTNGTTPTTASTKYTGAIKVSESETLKAIAAATNHTSSPVTSAAYTLKTLTAAATPAFSVVAGVYAPGQTVKITDATPGATIYYTKNGTTPTTASTKYAGPITVDSSQTIKAIASAANYKGSEVASALYRIAPPVATPKFSVSSGTYNSTQTVKITDAVAGAEILYTTTGTTATSKWTVYTGPITVRASETITAIASHNGYSVSAKATAAYKVTTPQATPEVAVISGPGIEAAREQ